MYVSKMNASVLEHAVHHLAIYKKYASKSDLVTQISHFLPEHYGRIGALSKTNSPA